MDANPLADFWQTALLGVFSFGFTFWIKTLHSTINRLWEENRQMYTVFQLKSDALRDQEQIMVMLSEIKQSIERMNDRIDRRTDATGGR
ncbi:hypothetical protein [Candidatus Erwinia dacicola]|uniref:Holin n=1 Tax=Candidatus Erwinia dacicola TaxID=252393 RepID=A0A1E7Z1L9_9GAMM|nr:hypothetical protein [Candidatus Erwinia dacicola]OFC62623.1 hypothetical protein BBW68_08945 [Candidatus Erwinia dacicola]RAP69777.1 hypothetical protein ACZ87_03430 [Candidatus Erwinia dacicola]